MNVLPLPVFADLTVHRRLFNVTSLLTAGSDLDPDPDLTLPPQVKDVFEQEGFSRRKRGYRNIDDIEVNMSDPLFTKQWYLVSNQPRVCLLAAWPFRPAHILPP